MDIEAVPARVLTTVREVLVPEVLRLTHPLFAQDADGHLELIGSSIIIDTGIARYVVTASHLANQVGKAPLIIGAGAEPREVRGKGWSITTANAVSGTDDDRADVTVIRLDSAVAAQFPDEALTPLAAVECDPLPDSRNPVLLLGYPCTKHKGALREQTFQLTSYSVVACEIEPAEYNALNTDRSTNLALSLDRKDVWNPSGGGTAPSLNGMSGSGVWRMSVYGDRPASSVWLAGLFIEHYQKSQIKHVVATRLAAVLAVVARIDRDLREALAEIGVLSKRDDG